MSGSAFLSELPIDEMLLLEQAQWHPVDLVAGQARGYVPTWERRHPARQAPSRERFYLSNALTEARRKAIREMRADAAAAGAHGVVGVRLSEHEDGERWWHSTAEGTAVRGREAPAEPTFPGDPLARHRHPFTAHLSGREVSALIRGGYQPLGIVVGVSVYRAKPDSTGWREVAEMSQLTEVVYGAREEAMTRMQDQAAGLFADGIVGVGVDTEITPHASGSVVRFSALGTAVRRAAASRHKSIRLGVPLGEGGAGSAFHGPRRRGARDG